MRWRPASWLLRDQRGLSAIEFAILLPIILVMFSATLTLGEGLMVKRRINQIAFIASDIVAQNPDWTDAQLKTLLDGATSGLSAFGTSKPTVQVNVLNIASNGAATVSWSYGYNTTALGAGVASPVTIPTTIATPGVQMVLVVVQFNLSTMFTALLSDVTKLTSYTLGANAFSRPRIGDTITKS